MAYRAEIAHHIRGRIRVKIPAAKGDDCLLEQIRQALGAIPGVSQASANPGSGSIVLHYNPDRHGDFCFKLETYGKDQIVLQRRSPVFECDELARTIEQEAEFFAARSHTARVLVELCGSLDREIKRATGNAVDLKVLFPLGLAAYTFLELGVEAATPVWLTLALFAAHHFVEMHAQPTPAH